jgi:DNA polymerase-3 subunit delta'
MLFSQVIGQDEVKRALLQCMQRERLPHALLFAGPEGAGQLPMALALIRRLHCEKRTDADGCGACSSCIKHNKLIHPDLHFAFPTAIVKNRKARSDEYLPDWRRAVLANPYMGLFDWYEHIGIENKQGYLSVDESAAIQQKLSLKPYEARHKASILWMADKLRTDAANKLLKIIEEPPEHTVFILITENPDLLPATLVSRTQLFRFGRVADEVLQKHLQSRGLEYHAAANIVRLGEGNVNLAHALAADDRSAIDLEKEFMDRMRMCYALSGSKNKEANYLGLSQWIERIGRAGRERQKNFLHYGLEVVRDCLMHNYAGEPLVRLNDELLPGFSRFAPFIHDGNAEAFEDELNKAHYHIERNANPRILFLDLSFKIHSLLHGAKS